MRLLPAIRPISLRVWTFHILTWHQDAGKSYDLRSIRARVSDEDPQDPDSAEFGVER